ncbi:MAG: hypothetical protein O3B43_06590 [Chloroflexi bacterium]|nr:hypothetical protein [Chloroflexota bacterium]
MRYGCEPCSLAKEHPIERKLSDKLKKIGKRLLGDGNSSFIGKWPPGDRELYYEQFETQVVNERRFYNVGAGVNFRHPAWQNVGLPSEAYGSEHVDMVWDLQECTPMPVDVDTAQIMYSRYTLEHVTDVAVQNFLNESYRVLRKGGVLRVIVPDIEVYYAAYEAREPELFQKPKRDTKTYPNKKFKENPNTASFEQRFLWTFASSTSTIHQMDVPHRIDDEELRKVLAELPLQEALDYCTARASIEFQRKFPQFHTNWFSDEKLARMMQAAGFTKPYRSSVGASKSPVLWDLRLFDGRRPEIGLFMEAIK